MGEVQGIQGGFVIKKGGDALVPEPAERFIVEGSSEPLHKAVQGTAFGQSGQIQMGVLPEKILKKYSDPGPRTGWKRRPGDIFSEY